MKIIYYVATTRQHSDEQNIIFLVYYNILHILTRFVVLIICFGPLFLSPYIIHYTGLSGQTEKSNVTDPYKKNFFSLQKSEKVKAT